MDNFFSQLVSVFNIETDVPADKRQCQNAFNNLDIKIYIKKINGERKKKKTSTFIKDNCCCPCNITASMFLSQISLLLKTVA